MPVCQPDGGQCYLTQVAVLLPDDPQDSRGEGSLPLRFPGRWGVSTATVSARGATPVIRQFLLHNGHQVTSWNILVAFEAVQPLTQLLKS